VAVNVPADSTAFMTAFLEAKFFFTHPYAAHERGLNENTNGLIRQNCPKKKTSHLLPKKILT